MDEKGKEEEAGATAGERSEPELALCPNCMAPNEPRADLCAKCGAPLTMFAMVDPLLSIRSVGWGYRQATSGRRGSRLIVVGMLLIFGVPLLGCLFLLFAGHDVEVYWGGMLFFVGLNIVYILILFKVVRNYRRGRTTRGESGATSETPREEER